MPEDGFQAIKWKFEKYGSGDHDVYRIGPIDDVQTNINVVMAFSDSEGNTGTSDAFDVGDLGRLDNFVSMKVYGKNIEEGRVKIVFDGGSYPITTGEANIDVRTTTSGTQYGFVEVGDPQEGTSGVSTPDGTVYTINTTPVQVDDQSGVALLFDGIVGNNDYNANNSILLKYRIDSLLEDLGGACVLAG